MVRIEVGGRPILDIDYRPAADASLHETRRVWRPHGTSHITTHHTTNFTWHHKTPRLVVTSDTAEFDPQIIENFQEEGFQVAYLPYDGDRKAYHNNLLTLSEPLGLGEKYAIVAYSDAAARCLDAATSPISKLCALIAYYPPYVPPASSSFPPSIDLQFHLASAQRFGTRHGTSYTYPKTTPGFAEHDLDEFSPTAARLAWSRTLSFLRRAFSLDPDLEAIWDTHTALEFETKDAGKTMATMVKDPYVNHVPTMTGGVGYHDLHRFYRDYFIPGNPDDMKMEVLTRTVGVDRIVDEMFVSFTHDCEVPWMLPGVPPTGKKVEVVVVAVVGIRGAKLWHEHIHWDQASVLVQVGLLDPKLVPDGFKTTEEGREKEVKRLPVVGREGARKARDEHDGKSNELIEDW